MVTRPHVCALKVPGEDLLEILPIINRVSRQVIEPSLGRVGKVHGEELDDEKVIIHHTYPTCETIVLQPSDGIGFAIVLDDVIGC
jgi:hypothetical protein